MKVINEVEDLLNLQGKNIGFISDSFNPPHFGHLEFIKKATSVKKLDHIIVCPQSDENEMGIEDLKHRLRIMDLLVETTATSNVSILSPCISNGIQSKIFIDDIFYLLKRRKKNVFVLIGCDSLEACAKTFKSHDVTFIVGCRIKRSDAEKQLVAEKMKCIFIDDIIPCTQKELLESKAKREIYLSRELENYFQENPLYGFGKDCNNCN